MEYRYSFGEDGDSSVFTTDREDVLFADNAQGLRGRIRPGSRTGMIPISVWRDGRPMGVATVEVRSRKLGYLSHYRWMLRDLADSASALILERFAASQQRFTPYETLEAQTAYERFAFLQSLIADPVFESAFAEILRRPHEAWVEEPEMRLSSRGLPPGSAGAKELLRSGPRTDWPGSFIKGLSSLPTWVESRRPVETVDTPPNQFVKFALTRWLSVVQALNVAIISGLSGAPRRRAEREIDQVSKALETMLAEPLFRDVGELRYFPAGNTVLLRASGYRDLLRAYALFESAAQLSWSGGENVYGAGQRDVATLYEYWCFLQVAKILKEMCPDLDERSLIQQQAGEVVLGLRKGRQTTLAGVTERLGRQFSLRLYYNRTFGTGNGPDTSWSRQMRPDCSLKLSTADPRGGFDTVWIHFDAKYRADRLAQVFGDEPDQTDDDELVDAKAQLVAKRDDLLKMHAYRDAISRSAGSYVLYPGSAELDLESPPMRQYSEILPGLGAFALRPAQTGEAEGVAGVKQFVDDVLDHFASVLTQDRRARFWESESFSLGSRVHRADGWEPSSALPPADTVVLLGLARSHEHLEWITRQRRYNLRLGDRRGSVGLRGPELAARLLVLYGPANPEPMVWTLEGSPEIWDRTDMRASGYPGPRGSGYLCLPLGREILHRRSSMPTLNRVRMVANPDGSPTMATWLDLVK